MVQKEMGIEPEPSGTLVGGALFVGLSYLGTAGIPLFPYFFLSGEIAILTSLLATLIALFCIGLLKAKFALLPYLKSGLLRQNSHGEQKVLLLLMKREAAPGSLDLHLSRYWATGVGSTVCWPRAAESRRAMVRFADWSARTKSQPAISPTPTSATHMMARATVVLALLVKSFPNPLR